MSPDTPERGKREIFICALFDVVLNDKVIKSCATR